MTPSSIRTRLVQLEVLPGLPCQNTDNMLQHVAAAIGEGIELLLFPEMAIPGYLIGDETLRPANVVVGKYTSAPSSEQR